MSSVWVAGVGMTRFGKFLQRSVRSLVEEAVAEALADARVAASDVEAVYFANAFGGVLQGQESVRGQVWTQGTGLEGAPTFNVENACASGGSALALAATALQAGQAETVIAVGVEKLHHAERHRPLEAMERALDQDRLPEITATLGVPEAGGSPFMQVYAEFARRYMERTGATQQDFARVASKSHDHGALNPRAQYRQRFTVEQILAARTIAGPLTLPMCAPIGDGAAAVVMSATSRDTAGTPPAVRLLAAALGSGRVGRENGHLVAATARRAFERAGVGPEDVDVLELHDAASPAEMILLEELGIVPEGGAVGLVREGGTRIGGRLPVNPSGGLVSKGHPLGASGLAQVVELTEQLRGRAGDRQVVGARVALAENAGGYLGPDAAVASVSILAR